MSPTLLVVDDDPPIQSLLEDTLGEAGYEVTAVGSAAQAIRLLEAGVLRPQGLITDLGLGQGPSGWDVARRACELQPNLAVVYITGGRGRDNQPCGAPEGVLLLKPFTRDQMLSVVGALLAA
jgi:DNA-binding response OmpR family regulator